eukprot:TRINITY_DN14518_c0_g1_i3.p2 TRINITY_DN14518_c0_g1~~TRINITY_DN14518_c0_g1_i3.p2  ORF type:complete len:142 (+),score=17.32 TRINITY_DN14518_c0_g1_i3:116-541(+)
MLKSKPKESSEPSLSCSKHVALASSQRLFVSKLHCDSYFSCSESFCLPSRNGRTCKRSKENLSIDTDSPTTTAPYSDTDSKRFLNFKKTSLFKQPSSQMLSLTIDEGERESLSIPTYGLSEVNTQTYFSASSTSSKSKSTQ